MKILHEIDTDIFSEKLNTMNENNLDFLFKDEISKKYLCEYTQYLEHILSNDVVDKFRTNNITLLVNIAPCSVIHNFCFPFTEPKMGHIIIIEKNTLKHCDFRPQEVSSMILHEFGHIFNVPDDESQKEFYADYYVKSLNLGSYLASALTKLLQKNFSNIDTQTIDEINNRISALKNNQQEPLVGMLKTLRIAPTVI